MSLKIIGEPPPYGLTSPLITYQKNPDKASTGIADVLMIKKNVHRSSNKKTLLMTASVMVATMVISAVLVSMLVIGAMYLDQCPADRKIPIFLIVCSWICLLVTAIEIYDTRKDGLGKNFLRILQITARIFLATWFVIGCLWIYSIYEPEYYIPSSSRYCHRVLYFYALAVINSTIICVIVCAAFYLRHRCLVSEKKMKGTVTSFQILNVEKQSLPSYYFRRTAAMWPTDKSCCIL